MIAIVIFNKRFGLMMAVKNAINENAGITESFDNIGFFICGINNLMEALNSLRRDADSEL